MHEAKKNARHVAHAKARQGTPSLEELLAKGDYEGLKVLKAKELSALCKEIGQPAYGMQNLPGQPHHWVTDKHMNCLHPLQQVQSACHAILTACSL